METLLNKWKAKTPLLFKRVILFLASLSVLSGSLAAIGDLPEPFPQITQYVAIAGAVGAFLSKFTTETNVETEEAKQTV